MVAAAVVAAVAQLSKKQRKRRRKKRKKWIWVVAWICLEVSGIELSSY